MKDDSLLEVFEDYVAKQRNHALFSLLTELADIRTPLYVWGMSQYAQLLLGDSPLKECSIKELVDGSEQKQGRSINGRVVQSPEVLQRATPGDAIVLAARGYREQMRTYLKNIQFCGTEIILD